ncbi:hypothetical protein [Streptomyces tibetensis]|uniref:hypothetical protein n=1 Tax=Streptomyces tibetensis TaxID=2382123 RepID=UPI003408FD94
MAPRLKRRTSGNSKPYGTLIPATAVTAALLTAITVGIAVGSWAGGLALKSALGLSPTGDLRVLRPARDQVLAVVGALGQSDNRCCFAGVLMHSGGLAVGSLPWPDGWDEQAD